MIVAGIAPAPPVMPAPFDPGPRRHREAGAGIVKMVERSGALFKDGRGVRGGLLELPDAFLPQPGFGEQHRVREAGEI